VFMMGWIGIESLGGCIDLGVAVVGKRISASNGLGFCKRFKNRGVLK